MPVQHEGNQNRSDEEVAAIVDLVDRTLSASPTWVRRDDPDGESRALTASDILIVAPYNRQVIALREALQHHDGIRVGTVDKFQGQEAPLVIYSMTTSTPQDAPRGMEFLYSVHRFNVATSRAQCLCWVVASPALLAADCKTPRQMRLANGLCAWVDGCAGVRSGPNSRGAAIGNASRDIPTLNRLRRPADT